MSNFRQGPNYYEILEVSPDAAQNEIHRAYQRAKQTYAQDNPALYSMFSKDEAQELGRLIEEAYAVLGNQGSRKAYDDNLSHGSSAGGGAPHPLTVAQPIRPQANPAMHAHVAHAALPDYEIKTNPNTPAPIEIEQNFELKRREPAAKLGLPADMSRTSLSTYKTDSKFEEEIKNCENFDGLMLQKIRLYKNVSMEKLSEATRVSRTYLTAVEENDIAHLPAAVFVRGFVVQMAKILGLEDQKVANSYMKNFRAKFAK